MINVVMTQHRFYIELWTNAVPRSAGPNPGKVLPIYQVPSHTNHYPR